MPGIYLLKKWEVLSNVRDTIFRTRCKKMYYTYNFLVKSASTCIGEHYWRYSGVRDFLLSLRLLAVCMSGFCAVGDSACASRTSNLSFSGIALRILPMLVVICGCSVLPIGRSGIRCSILLIRRRPRWPRRCPRAYQDQFRGFGSPRVHARRDFFKKIDWRKA